MKSTQKDWISMVNSNKSRSFADGRTAIESSRLSVEILSASSGREALIARASIGFPGMGQETLVQILLQCLA
jgi:hypothetical protein